MRLLKFLIMIPLVLGAVALVAYLIPLPDSMAEPWSEERHLIAAVATGIAGAIYLAWLFLYVKKQLWSGARALDPLITGRGFTVAASSGFARHYRGQSGGFPVELVLRPAYRLEPWRIELFIDGGPGLEMAMGNKKPLQVKSGYRLIAMAEPGFTLPVVLARDDSRAKRYLAHPAVQNALRLLLANLSQTTGWELYLEPQQIRAFFRNYEPEPTALGAWLDILPKLAAGDKQE